MTYMIEQADNVAAQLEKFASGYAHHVVGQHASFDFWLDEASHALSAVEDYGARFKRMAGAQKTWVSAHGTKVGSFCELCGGACDLEDKMRTPPAPKRVSSSERDKATRRLKDAAYHFARRCYRMRLLDEDEFRAACARVGTSVDLAALARRN